MLFSDNCSLGRRLSRIGFGGASLSGEGGGYGFGALSEYEAEALIRYALELGINVFDTAPIYGFGLSEERLGRYLPSEALVVSKGGVDWHPNKRVNLTNEPRVLLRQFEETRRRLRRERVDVYLIHWPDPRVDIRNALEPLISLREKGSIGFLGLCNTNANDLTKARAITTIDVLQSECNVFSHPLSFVETENSFTMGWGTFDKGILSGRVLPGRTYSAEDARSWAPWWNKKDVLRKISEVEKLKSILTERGFTLTQFALSFSLCSGIQTALVGAKTISDLVSLVESLDKLLSPDEINTILSLWKPTE